MVERKSELFITIELHSKEVNLMNKIQIGDTVEIKARIVDYNDSSKKVKLRITGYEEDKETLAERYIWLNYNDIKQQN